MIPRKLFAFGVGAAVLGLSLTLAAPANAAQTRALPTGETLYAIDCEDSIGQLASFDVTTAVGTAIGTGSTDSHVDCAADSTYDVTTGKVFWAAWSDNNELFSMDPATGDSTFIGTMDTLTNTVNDISALMSGTDGVLYAVFSSNDGNAETLGTVDKATGVITFAHTLLNGSSELTDRDLWSGEFNPADGTFYVINYEELFSLDVTTGALTSKGLNTGDNVWYGLTFDSNGVMWTTGQSAVASSTVDGWSTGGNQETSDNDTTIDASSWYSESNFIILTSAPAAPVVPTLAATGVNGAQAGLIAASGAVVALLGAGAALAARRRKVNN
jgi:hypothetical protein